MIYRLAGEADLPALAQMRWAFRSEHELPSDAMPKAEFLLGCLDFFRLSLASGRWAFWVAEDGGQIIAQAFVQVVPKLPDLYHLERGFGYVTNVYTLPEYPDQGIGAKLMEHLKGWSLERGLEFLILWPSSRAVPFYTRAGFQPAQRILQYRLPED